MSASDLAQGMKHKERQWFCTPLPVSKFEEPITCFLWLCVRLKQPCRTGLGQSFCAKSNFAHEVTSFPDFKFLDSPFIWALITFYWAHFSPCCIFLHHQVLDHIVELLNYDWTAQSKYSFHTTVTYLAQPQHSTVNRSLPFLKLLKKTATRCRFSILHLA